MSTDLLWYWNKFAYIYKLTRYEENISHVPEKYLVGYSDNLRDFFTNHYFQYATNIVHHNENHITFYNEKYVAEMELTAEEIKNNETCFMKFL